MLTPRSGLPLFFVGVFLFVLLLNTLVAQPDRVRLLRSLAVMLGSALVLKFVVLGVAVRAHPGAARRACWWRCSTPRRSADHAGAAVAGAGYLAFFATALFLAGVGALPAARPFSGRPALGSFTRAELEPAPCMQSIRAWRVVRRTKTGIDVLEHAMQGVHTSENRGQIVSFHAEPGIIGMRSEVEVRSFKDTPVEREVIVKMPHVPIAAARR